MADYRRHYDERPRRHARDWSDRAADEVGSWFGDKERPRRDDRGSGNDERDDRFPYGGERNGGHEGWRSHPHPDTQREDRASRWEGPRDDRDQGYYAAQAFGAYRTDDRQYHDRYRPDRYRVDADRDRDEARYGSSWNRPYQPRDEAADEYFRAARAQRDDLRRYEAQSPGAEFESREDWYNAGPYNGGGWQRRDRNDHARHYESRSPYAGRGPKDYRRSDERVLEEICDCMTEDPMLDASEISVQVREGVVTLTGSVTSRDQKRRAEDVAERVAGVNDVTNQLRVSREANGHAHAAARPVTQSEPGTPSKSSSTTT